MPVRILRGVRVATPDGIQPASVHIKSGRIVAIAGYHDVPRLAHPEELGKSLLMPGLILAVAGENNPEDSRHAAASGITTLLRDDSPEPGFVDEAAGDAIAWEEQHVAIANFLPRIWTQARDHGESLESLVDRLALGPAQHAGIDHRKGKLAIDYDADFVIWNPELTVVNSSPLLYGAIRQTILRGHTIFKEGQWVGEPRGQEVPTSMP